MATTRQRIVPPKGQSSLLAAALEYHQRGWSVVPMKMQDKRPAIRWKPYQTTRATEAKLREWFDNGASHGIGVVFGSVSGDLAERDFDERESYLRWAEAFPHLATTLPTVETRRGQRVMFQAAPGSIARLRSAIGKPAGIGAVIGPDGELRAGCGCYSVLPPSIHPSRHVYRWQVPLPVGALPVVDPVEAGLWSVAIETARPDLLETPVLKPDSKPEKHPLITPNCLQNSLFSLDSLPSLLHEQVKRAIERSLPTSTGKRHKAVFELCRELKAIAEFADVRPQRLRPIVKQWHAQALPFIINARAFEESWFDFLEGWDKVKYPKGQGLLDVAFRKAQAAALPDVAKEYEQSELQLLTALCRELQRADRAEPFYLATREAGRLLGISSVHASRWLKLLCHEGILAVVMVGSQKTGKASRYRYLASLD